MLVHHDSHGAIRQTFTIEATDTLDLKATVLSHGWVMLAPWRWDGQRLARSECFGERRGLLSIRQSGGRELAAEWTGSHEIDKTEIGRRIHRWLSWDWEAVEFRRIARALDPKIAVFVESGGGRFLRGSSFYEDFIKTVCTINTTWGQTLRMVAALVEIGDGRFPTPAEVLEAGATMLKEQCRLGFRSDTVLQATSRMLQDRVMDEDGHAGMDAASHKYLLSLWGIGPYAAAHCRMLLHDFSRLPIDSEVSAYLMSKGVPPGEFERHFAKWGAYAFLGYKLQRIIEKSNWIGDDVIHQR